MPVLMGQASVQTLKQANDKKLAVVYDNSNKLSKMTQQARVWRMKDRNAKVLSEGIKTQEMEGAKREFVRNSTEGRIAKQTLATTQIHYL